MFGKIGRPSHATVVAYLALVKRLVLTGALVTATVTAAAVATTPGEDQPLDQREIRDNRRMARTTDLAEHGGPLS